METHLFHQQKAMKDYTDWTGIKIKAWSLFVEGQHDFFRNEVLTALAGKYNRTVAQAELRWLTQRGIIVIPKSVHRNRIEENFNSLDFRLLDEDMELLATCDIGKPVADDFDNPDFVYDLCTRKYDF
ncbi:aldo/keto reductase [Bacteroides sp. D2]|uniref:aldo/keto reductase n=1 Tax=Bacteroides sp. D2 TaxID=556259 RepID=UPI0001BC8297|nr:aldo/keto reductase [Bacteroides sp. D2]EFS32742.1 hypothetical protein BSGG_3442 [Bacteroides sp. D2]UWN99197.1 aldo/keto reductase [Bacteroides sp. D2]